MSQISRRKSYTMKIIWALIIILLAMWVVAFTTTLSHAQEQNLLTNPSFEGGYSSHVPNPPRADCPLGICTTAQMASGWQPWWVSQDPSWVGTDLAWKNRMPEYKRAEAPYLSRIHSGESAQQYFTFWSSHTAGIYQRVNVPNGSVMRFTIYGQAWSTHDDEPVSGFPTAVNMKIGIDPLGGTNPFSPDIVWSGTQNPYDAYALFSVEARAQSDFITVFTYSREDEPRKHNDIYWDTAALSIVQLAPGAVWPPPGGTSTGTSGNSSSPAPAAPAVGVIPFYLSATPTPNAEGVILVEVPQGASLWSIAANAGITLDEIMSLNNLAPGSFVQPGQLLIVGYGASNGSETEVVEDVSVVEASDETNAEADISTVAETETQIDETVVEETVLVPTPQTIPTPNISSSVAVVETNTAICLSAFNDDNENGLFDPGETLQPNVAFTVASGQRVVSNYVTTGNNEPYCIQGLDTGNYQITRSKTSDEVLTTRGEWSVALTEGSAVTLEFGSHKTSEKVASVTTTTDTNTPVSTTTVESETENGNNGLLTIGAVAVALLLLGGIVFLALGSRR